MRLIHYGEQHLTEVYNRNPAEGVCGVYKPCGLWVSAEGADDWANWCHEAEYGLGAYATEVVLAEGADILHLADEAALDEFQRQYSVPLIPHKPELGMRSIDWAAVGAKHDGIIIAPYIWSNALHRIPTIAAVCVGLLVFGILKVLTPEPGPYEDD